MLTEDQRLALENIHSGKLPQDGEYLRVPTAVFVQKIDLKMPPLPAIAFYDMEGGKPELIREADEAFSPLVLAQYAEVWIRAQDLRALRKYAENLLTDPQLISRDLPAEQRMAALRRSAMIVVEDLFENPTPENISRSQKVVSSFVYVLMRDPQAYLFLTRLSSHDPYTLQHSVGAAVNSLILARKIGIKDEKELQDIGMGGLLHDVGKVKVKKEIINKPGPLDELEWEEMRQHSLLGYEIIKDNPDLSDKTKLAILQHHEDRFGTGYPYGLKDDQIDISAKIVCLADVFNALTTNRSYSEARNPFDAFQIIRQKLLNKVNEELFRQLVLIYGGK